MYCIALAMYLPTYIMKIMSHAQNKRSTQHKNPRTENKTINYDFIRISFRTYIWLTSLYNTEIFIANHCKILNDAIQNYSDTL